MSEKKKSKTNPQPQTQTQTEVGLDLYYILKFRAGEAGLVTYEVLGKQGFFKPEQAYLWLETATGSRGGTIVKELTPHKINSDWTVVIDYTTQAEE